MGAKELILHIGAPKTGTSAFQAYCAQHAGFLEEHLDLLYPDLSGNHRMASRNAVTSGNGLPITRWLDPEIECPSILRERGREQFGAALDLLDRMPTKRMLISSEDFCHVRIEGFSPLSDACGRVGVNLRLIGLVRDILPWIMSVYAQQVKGSGLCGSLEDFLREYPVAFEKIEELIEFAKPRQSVSLEILNYADLKSDIGPKLLRRVVGDAPEIFPESGGKRVNRSLDAWETRLMSAARTSLSLDDPADSRDISDALIYSAPDRFVPRPSVTEEVSREVSRRNEASLRVINDCILGTPISVGGVESFQKAKDPGQDIDLLDALERQTVLSLAALKKESEKTCSAIRERMPSEEPECSDEVAADRSGVSSRLDALDYYVHLWISKFPLMAPSARRRFAEAARKRRPSG